VTGVLKGNSCFLQLEGFTSIEMYLIFLKASSKA